MGEPIATTMEEESVEERAYEKSEQVDVFGDDGEQSLQQENYSFSWSKLWRFMGPGFLMSIAYLDPGNIESDLQVGAQAGYNLLWLLLLATLMGLFIQLLSARLGVATGFHLAELCKVEYSPVAKVVLWIMTEIAIIGSDIQEVIGSAIAFRILSNGFIPIWAGVLLTGIYGFLFLFLENFGVRKLEAFFALLILVMGISFAGMFAQAKPDGASIISGLLIPRIPGNAVDKAVGIVGCVIMPHNIFLHSALVQSRSIDSTNKAQVHEALRYYSIESTLAISITFIINLFIMSVFAKSFYGKAAAENIGLANAGEYLQEVYGRGIFPIMYIWAIGLLAAGQSSTMTSTYTGQFVMAGFLNLRIQKWVRVVVTRSVAVIPTIIVALAFNTSENKLDRLNEWLNVLQSLQLPFALIPLLTMVSQKRIMGSFTITPTIKLVAGALAMVIIAINFYLLAISIMGSLMMTSIGLVVILIVGVLSYFSLIIYLILQPLQATNLWKTIITTTRRKHVYEEIDSAA